MKKAISPWKVALLCLGASAAAQAGVNSWTNVGIHGAAVLEVQYVSAGVALAVTNVGLYRTTDHGANWTLIRSMRLMGASIAVNRANPDQVIVTGDTTLRSVNRGATFTSFPLGGVVSFDTQYAGFSSDGFYAWVIQPDGDVWRSADGGATWTGFTGVLPAGANWTIEVDATDHDTVYASYGASVYVSRNAGANWTPIPTASGPYFFQARPSRVITGTIFGINAQGNIPSRSSDFGANWVPMASDPAPGWMNSLATSPSGFMVAGTYDGRVFISANEGATWTDRGRLPNSWPIRFAIDPTDDEHILAATPGGIIGSDNRGFTWSERNVGLLDVAATDIATARDGTNAVYISTTDLNSVYRRDSATGNYTAVGRNSTPTLGFPGMYGYRIAAAPQSGNTLYMLREGRLGRSTDGGSSWTRLADLPLGYHLTLDPSNPLVAYVTGQRLTVKTVNGGATFTPIGAGLTSYFDNGLGKMYVDPSNSANVYALVTGGPGATSPVFRSTDGGVTFTPSSWSAATDLVPSALAFEPGRSSTLYVSMNFGTFKSIDSGVTWTTITGGGADDLVVDPQSPEVVYSASLFRNVLRSIDGGVTWAEISPSSPNDSFGFTRIALVPGHNAKLVGMRGGGGVYEIDIAPPLGLGVTPATLTSGQPGSFVLSVRNNGVVAATRVRITATLPESTVTYGTQITLGSCTVNGRDLSCDIGTLARDASASVTVTFTPTGPGTTEFRVSSYETTGVPAQTLTVQAASSGSGGSAGGGGGGGGRLDYLLLAFLVSSLIGRRRFGSVFRRVRKH